MSDDNPNFESWGILEIMGHARFAGKISNEAIGGCNFVRIDVPEVRTDPLINSRPAFTKYFTQAAIFSLTPTTEDLARAAAAEFRSLPASLYDLTISRSIEHDPDFDDPEDAQDFAE